MGTLALSSEPVPALAVAALIPAKHIDSSHHVPGQEQGTVDALTVEKAWAPSNGGKITTDSAIVLENIAAGFKKPNILDVKLGARLWADDAPVAKRVRLDKVAEETTSKALGLRIAGMRTWQGSDAVGLVDVTLDGYKLYDKDYGKKFNTKNVYQGFEDYFCLTKTRPSTKPIRNVIRRFIEDLEGLQGVIEKEESRMYSSSLLFVYEGDDLALQEAFSTEKQALASLAHDPHDTATSAMGTLNGNGAPSSNGAPPSNPPTDTTPDPASDQEEDLPSFPQIQSLRLIDFAHAEWTPGKGLDLNLLHGIRNVIKILTKLLD